MAQVFVDVVMSFVIGVGAALVWKGAEPCSEDPSLDDCYSADPR